MKRVTAFLDQGEFMGGAEHFLLDFLSSLSPTERRRLNPIIFGGQSAAYQARLGPDLRRIDFVLPPVKGGYVAKLAALWKLLWTARRLKLTLNKEGVTQLFTNTPRAHLTALVLKRVWGWPGSWTMMVHDFTTRPAGLVRRLGASADVVVANSMPTRGWLRQQFKEADHAKIRLVENGVQTSNNAIEPVTEVMQVLNLSRIDPRKGQQYFTEAADLLQERNPDLRFWIVGDSVSTDPPTLAYESTIKQFAVDRKLENLEFKPGVEDPLEVIDHCDVLVFTPTEGETFGRVIIEALSRGKLALSFAVTGPQEILQHYERWLLKKGVELPEPGLLLVEVNNAMSLAERIAYFADNPGLVELYTKKAAEFVAQNYSLAETKKRLLDVLGV